MRLGGWEAWRRRDGKAESLGKGEVLKCKIQVKGDMSMVGSNINLIIRNLQYLQCSENVGHIR